MSGAGREKKGQGPAVGHALVTQIGSMKRDRPEYGGWGGEESEGGEVRRMLSSGFRGL